MSPEMLGGYKDGEVSPAWCHLEVEERSMGSKSHRMGASLIFTPGPSLLGQPWRFVRQTKADDASGPAGNCEVPFP